MPYIVREFTAEGTEVFRDHPKFSVITGNFRRFFLRKKRKRAKGRLELTISSTLILSSTPRPWTAELLIKTKENQKRMNDNQ